MRANITSVSDTCCLFHMIRWRYNERKRIWYWFVKKHSIYFDGGNRTLTKVTTWQIISAELPPFLLPSSPSCCASWQSACSSRTWGPPAEKTKCQVRTRDLWTKSPPSEKPFIVLKMNEKWGLSCDSFSCSVKVTSRVTEWSSEYGLLVVVQFSEVEQIVYCHVFILPVKFCPNLQVIK